jgi:hypothetical protein
VLGRPSDGEVDLMGGALVMGGGGRCRHDVRRSGAESWMRSRVRERGERKKPSALHAPFMATRGSRRRRVWQWELWVGNGGGAAVWTGWWSGVVCTKRKKALAFPSGGTGGVRWRWQGSSVDRADDVHEVRRQSRGR